MGMMGKIIGGMAGFAVGGPFGAAMGVAFGHAADTGATLSGATKRASGFGFGFGGLMQDVMQSAFGSFGAGGASDPWLAQARLAGMIGRRDQVFSIAAVVLAAKLARADGPVNRAEIDAFKRHVRVPPEAMHEIGRMFDQAREHVTDASPYAVQVAQSFADLPGMREDLLAMLFAIARADGPLNQAELSFLDRIRIDLRLEQLGWDRARGAAPPRPPPGGADPYATLGVRRTATDIELRTAWKALMREHHPDSLAGRGASAAATAAAGQRVAAINAAWDQIKRERGL
jgi:DnaJ like chaperone protein